MTQMNGRKRGRYKMRRRKAKEWYYATALFPRHLNQIFSPPIHAALCTPPLVCCSKAPTRRFSRVPHLSSHELLSCLDRRPPPDPVTKVTTTPRRFQDPPVASDHTRASW